MTDILITKLNEKLAQTQDESGTIIVLKGFPLSVVNTDAPHIASMVENKFAYFMQLIQSNRKYILYEEYICLYEFLIQQFRSIIVVENNLYINLYPLYANISNEIISGLRVHFDTDNQNQDDVIGDISEYIQIYSNYSEIGGISFIVYNDPIEQIRSEKIKTIKLLDNKDSTLQLVILTEEQAATLVNSIEIMDEVDYVNTLRYLFKKPDELYINYDNCAIDKVLVEEKLCLVAGTFSEWTDIYHYKVSLSMTKKASNKEYERILKKYWGKDHFKTISVYDIAKLEEGIKEVTQITQENIIADLINEVEECQKDKDSNFRDVFVTAPTGAGKSAMFQIPAIYLAEKYNLVTLVVSPLIGLMNDQVYNLEKAKYEFARTINSDISPIIRQEIIAEVAEGKCHILYLSPESLLSRSDIEQLIGNRTIGMIVIDEAHIVTTWGKQFRPDYWYLGEHIRKLRKKQRDNKGHPFVIATFTATAIYGGIEDMYQETINSLHMRRPITYLGYVKRSDIDIKINELKVVTNRAEYEFEKFKQLIKTIDLACQRGNKMLIYFPTVALIERFYDYCYSTNKELYAYISKYHGQLSASDKAENYQKFYSGEKLVMLATKAFGMGIDINDITIVCHFAPTGNVCDYVQEIGRAARRPDLQGEAIYEHMRNDFKHINRLHGLSTIQKYQLVEVIKKVYELHRNKIAEQDQQSFTRKRNEMLVDAESFAYIFEGPMSDENDAMNKVKTAMLIIQKDYESRQGFAPFHIRPIPLFATGFFALSEEDQKRINIRFGKVVERLDESTNVCAVNLRYIWEKGYSESLSFPKFKYLLYAAKSELDLTQTYKFIPALSVDVYFENNSSSMFNKVMASVRDSISRSLYDDVRLTEDQIIDELFAKLGGSRYKLETLVNVLIAAMDTYRKNYATTSAASIYNTWELSNGKTQYRFNNPVEQFFKWLEKGYTFIAKSTIEEKLYLVNEGTHDRCREYITILGVLEAFGILTFKSLGGANSQIYIYVNQTKALQMVMNKPSLYKNRLLEMVGTRHKISVAMLSFLYQSQFTSQQIWEFIEDYFLGKIPDGVKVD